MGSRQATIINKLGLHARASAKFVNVASKFNCDIDVCHGNKTVNGKSIMGVMMLAAKKGTELTIHAKGDDANAALDAICDLIDKRFGEPE